MYKQFYLMQKDPFGSHPSPELFYNSHVHRIIWDGLIQGIASGESFLLTTGGYGEGKTLLCFKLVKHIRQTYPGAAVVFLSSPGFSFHAVLEKILTKLGIGQSRSGTNPSESELQNRLYKYFEVSTPETRQEIFVILDDVQDFDHVFLNKLRILSTYNHQGYFPIKLILFGHHQTVKKLEHKNLVPLKQRIRRHYQLKPLTLADTKEYIYFRLIYSGASGTPVFDSQALALIHKTSRGIPRLINNLCHNCLLSACNDRLNRIDGRLVTRVIRGMTPGNVVPPPPIETAEPPMPAPDEHPAAALPNGKISLRMRSGDNGKQQPANKDSEEASSGKNSIRERKTLSRSEDLVNMGLFSGNRGRIIILLIIILSLLYFIFMHQDLGWLTGAQAIGTSESLPRESLHYHPIPQRLPSEETPRDSDRKIFPVISMALKNGTFTNGQKQKIGHRHYRFWIDKEKKQNYGYWKKT